MIASILLYCRRGFEKECASEIAAAMANLGAPGYVRAKPESAYVVFVPHEAEAAAALKERLKWRSLVFARQLLFATPLLADLPVTDRITPLLARAQDIGGPFGDVWLETADTDDAKELSSFCRKFAKPFRAALVKAALLVDDDTRETLPRLHVFFLGSAAAILGVSTPNNRSDWAMGIPRLRQPRAAPSRSALKLAEAFLEFVGGQNAGQRLRAGQTAVDLGAAPGGWSWQLAQREIHVTAIDNGNLDKALLAGGMVEHIRADAFHWRPKRPVDWLVCDMVEKPSRVAALIADWAAEHLFREAIFNLKLPMKKRYEEVEACRALIEGKLATAGVDGRLRFKQLYHDREEVTGHLWLSRGKG